MTAKSDMTPDEVLAQLRVAFADVPRPGVPKDYVPSGKLGNPGWDEFTYHSALVFAEQVPDHVKRVFESPEEDFPRFLWHLSDSERLGVFAPNQMALLLRVLDYLKANYGAAIRKKKDREQFAAVRAQLEKLAG